MNKTNQISAKTQYVTPWCKSIVMETQSLVCQSPGYGDSGKAGAQSIWDNEETGEDY